MKTFQKRDPKTFLEVPEHICVQVRKELDGRCLQPAEYTKPQLFLLFKKLFQAVKCRRGYPEMTADLFYSSYVQEVAAQDTEKKSKGVRAIGNQAGREEGMGVSAGTAPVPLYLDFMDNRMVLLHFDQITVIMGEPGQAAFRSAMRTGSLTNTETGSIHVNPLTV